MNKRLIIALLLITVVVLLLLVQRGNVDLNLVFTKIRQPAGLAYLYFMMTGVVTGLLLK